jgi:curved DNA-binding protein CbpA
MSEARPPGTDDESDLIFSWDRQLDHVDYYSLLEVQRLASQEELRRAYHRFALVFHPDRRPYAGREQARALTRIFQRGAEAYRILSDPEARVRYASSLERGEHRLQESVAPRFVDPAELLPALHEACRSAGAKLAAQQAARAWNRGDQRRAKKALEEALKYDGEANPDISRCIEALHSSAQNTVDRQDHP